MIKDIQFFESPNFNDRTPTKGAQKPWIILLHYTGTKTFNEAHEIYLTPQKVAPHYMVDRDGKIAQYVDEKNRAWHAGESFWAGCTDINSASIGIEIVNNGHEHLIDGKLEEFSAAEIEAVIKLVRDIQARWNIQNRFILSHADVSITRKIDVGEHFPWEELVHANIGLLPRSGDAILDAPLNELFTQFGYNPNKNLDEVITAFRRHYLRRTDVNLGEDTEIRAAISSLLQQIK